MVDQAHLRHARPGNGVARHLRQALAPLGLPLSDQNHQVRVSHQGVGDQLLPLRLRHTYTQSLPESSKPRLWGAD